MTTHASNAKRRAPRAASKPAKSVRAATLAGNVGAYMTRSPHCIGKDQTLATAQALMRSKRLRHLPVLHGGKLVGMLSQRDIYFVETLRGVEPGEDRVEDAMTQGAYEVAPSATLRSVVDTMARRKLGSAVVVDERKVVGVFTTTDALSILGKLLARKPA